VIKPVFQPAGSRLCGHACVAMVVGVPLEEVIAVIGHSHGTKTKELVSALRCFGVVCSNRLRVVKTTLPDLCIAEQPNKTGSNWHWVVMDHGRRYDPAALCSDPNDNPLSSYLEIEK